MTTANKHTKQTTGKQATRKQTKIRKIQNQYSDYVEINFWLLRYSYQHSTPTTNPLSRAKHEKATLT